MSATIPNFTLNSGQWQQLVLPGRSTGVSVQSLFGDDLPVSQYNNTWVIYRWDANADEYVNPGVSGSIPTGHGFWIMQTTGSPVELDAPALVDAPVTSSNACAGSAGCTEVELGSATGGSRYNMIGSALPGYTAVDSIRVLSDTGNCANGCTQAEANDFGYVEPAIWRYNPDSAQYLNLAESGSLGPWESAWIEKTAQSAGVAVSYLFPAAESSTAGICQNAPALPPLSVSDPGKSVVRVSTEAELRTAMSNLTANTVILIAPGTYQLSRTLWVSEDNVTIRGDSDRCDAVRLVGMGMENAAGESSVPHGVWSNAANLKVQNLAIEQVYYHPIAIDAQAQAPQIYNLLMLDAGEQFVKVSSSPTRNGSNNGRVEYSVMKYTNGPPTTDHGGGIGYTQGVDIHNGNNWVVRNNRFENFHTPDTADHLWSPVVLAWRSASNTLVENNLFIDVDRAIAFGLANQPNDHSGGIIRNNMIVLRPNLFSAQRRRSADAPIIIWSSPGSQVLHNTILTNGNSPFAIELRFDSANAIVRNNLSDAPIRDRSSNQYVDLNNVNFDNSTIFENPNDGDLHLSSPVSGITNSVPTLQAAPQDFDGQSRSNTITDAGADEYTP